MYITRVLFKRGLVLSDIFCWAGPGLTVDFKDSFSEFLPANFPLSVWHEHVTCNCVKKKRKKKDFILKQRRVGGLNLHSSFAPVRKEDHKIILKTIAITGSIL